MKKTSKMALVLVAVLLAVFTLGGCAKTQDPTVAPVDGKKTFKVGIVQPVEHLSLNEIRDYIISELEALDTDNQIEIIYKNAQGDPTNINAIAKQFVGDKVDLIIPIATGPAQVVAAETKDIPIVFAAISYPVEAGLVDSMDASKGNVTGLSNAVAEEEIFKLADELTPGIKTYGFIYNMGEVNSVSGIEKAKEYCDANGISYIESTITNASELLQAAQSLVGRVDAIYVPTDNTVASMMSTLANEANKANIPVYVSADSMVKDGGLATVGIDYKDLSRQVAEMTKRILIDGESIAENPPEIVNEYARMINVTTAAAIGVEIPDALKDTFLIIE